MVLTMDENGDGVIDHTTTDLFSSDHRGRTVSWTDTEDVNNDGTPDQTDLYTNTYDGRGHLTLAEHQILGPLGTPAGGDTTSYAYNAQGRLISQVFTYRGADNTVLAIQTFGFVYNRQGNVTSSTQTFDDNGDGAADGRAQQDITYDSSGQPIHQVASFYREPNDSLRQRQVTDQVFDSHGRVVSAVQSQDENGDGVVDFTDTLAVAYDSAGRFLRSTETFVDVDTGSVSRLSSEARYDAKGRIVQQVLRSSDGGVFTTTYSYVSKTTVVVTYADDRNGDGTVDSSYSVTRTVS